MSDLETVKKMAEQTASTMSSYQSKLLEMAQENMKLTVEYSQAMMSIKSPSEFMSVNTDYAQQRMAMFQRHSQELASLITPR